MKRFYFGSEDEGDDDEAESFEMPSASELIAMTNPESPFRALMECSVRICERNFVWRFISPDDKVAMIRKVFENLAQMEKEYERDAQIRDEM